MSNEITGNETLTAKEFGLLRQHEEKIERGLKTFVDVGEALMAIRDAKLYRQHHETFEDYCRGRWQIGRHRAMQLMAAADAISGIGDNCQQVPSNEAQARPLASLPAEDRKPAWEEAVVSAPKDAQGKPKVTAAHVEKVVASRKADRAIIDTDTGEVLDNAAVIAEAKKIRQEAKTVKPEDHQREAEKRWMKTIHDALVPVNSIRRDMGGGKEWARKWDKETLQRMANELRMVIDEYQQWLKDIEGAIA